MVAKNMICTWEIVNLIRLRQCFDPGRSDPLIFGPLLFSSDPDPDPPCNNGYMKLFSS